MRKIENYSFGSVEVDGRRFRKDLIVYPDKIAPEWWRKKGHRLQLEDLTGVFEDPPEVLVVGQGDSGMMQIDPSVIHRLEALGIQLIAARTGEACEKFNGLSSEGKQAVAALHLTC